MSPVSRLHSSQDLSGLACLARPYWCRPAVLLPVGKLYAVTDQLLTLCDTLTLDQCHLAVSLTVGKLKVVVERLFKVKQAKQALFLQVSTDDPCPENIGDQEDRELYYFGIQVLHNIHGVVLQH